MLAGAAEDEDPNTVPLVGVLPPNPKRKPVDDGVLPPTPAGHDARAAKPPLPPPLPNTGAVEPEPNTGAVFSCSVALGASTLAGGLPKVALPVEPNEKPPFVVVGADPKEGAAPLPPRVLGLPNEKPPTAVPEVFVLLLAEADDAVSFIEAKGFLGAASFAGAAAEDDDDDVEANGFFGAARDIGGKTVLEAGLAAGAGAGAAEKGLFGATALIGGNLEGAGFLAAAAGAAV